MGTTLRPRLLVLLAALALQSCSDSSSRPADTAPPAADSGALDAAEQDAGPDGAGPDGAGADAGPPDSGPRPLSSDWCDRVAVGPPGERAIAIDLSAAHSTVRFFGVQLSYANADQALARALAPIDALAPERVRETLDTYVSRLDWACASGASAARLSAVRVEMRGDVAVVHPGTGAVGVPESAVAVAVDLRDLPAAPELRAALEAAVTPALAVPVTWLARNQRTHGGMTDEVFGEDNVYRNGPQTFDEPVIPAGARTQRPLVLLVGPVLAPDAAALALSLRLADRAWLVGADVHAAVAEARWQPVGEHGIVTRVRDLWTYHVEPAEGPLGRSRLVLDRRVPDVLEPDFPTSDPDTRLDEALAAGASPPPRELGDAERGDVRAMYPFGRVQPASTERGAVRAALVAAHGATRLFFPYFEVVGDGIDERLLETLAMAAAEEIGGAEMRNLLRRFGQVLRDGHNFVLDQQGSVPSAGFLPLLLERIEGAVVVRRSWVEGIDRGDTVLSIDGTPIEDLYTQENARTSAASDGYRFDLASRELTTAEGPARLELRDAEGAVRALVVEPTPSPPFDAHLVSSRGAGTLADLGAPELYYMNLDVTVLDDDEVFRQQLRDALSAGATGLVLDMRGYPRIDHYELAQRLIPEPFTSPIFRIPLRPDPDTRTIDESLYPLEPLSDPAFDGPIALLVGPHTVSAAENFSIMLVGAHRVTVVGRPSAATNGNICGIQLPGGFAFTFTCMEILFPDRGRFHGVGIVPDVPAEPTIAELAAGADPELEAAVRTLRTSP